MEDVIHGAIKSDTVILTHAVPWPGSGDGVYAERSPVASWSAVDCAAPLRKAILLADNTVF